MRMLPLSSMASVVWEDVPLESVPGLQEMPL